MPQPEAQYRVISKDANTNEFIMTMGQHTSKRAAERQASELSRPRPGKDPPIAGEVDELKKSSSEPLKEADLKSRMGELPTAGKRTISLLKEYGEQLKSKVKNLTGVDVSDVDIVPALGNKNQSEFNTEQKRVEMKVGKKTPGLGGWFNLRSPGEIFDTLLHEFSHAGSMRGGLEAVHLIGGTYNFPLGKGVKAVTL